MRSAVILGNGKYAQYLFEKLRKTGKVDVAISMFGGQLDTVSGADYYVDSTSALEMGDRLISILLREQISTVVFGGDFRLATELRSYTEDRVSAEIEAAIAKILNVESIQINSIADLLLEIKNLLDSHNISPHHAGTLLPELRPGVGFLCQGSCTYSESFVTSLVDTARVNLGQHPPFGVRHSFLFDNLELIHEEEESTDSMLQEMRRHSVRARPRSLVKLAPPGVQFTLDAPVIGPKTIELAADALVELIVIDAAQGIITEKETTIAEAEKLGIAIFGWQQ